MKRPKQQENQGQQRAVAKMLKTDVDYGYYVSSFSGGMQPKLSALEFYTCSNRAAAFLDSLMCEQEPSGIEKRVKDCLCCLTEEISRRNARKGVKSENTDGYSVAFCEDDGAGELFKIVNTYLGGLGIVFAGVDA